jgi:hypothetical protein
MAKVKVLIVAADPSSWNGRRPRLLLDEEARQIRQSVHTARHRDQIELDFRWAVRTNDLLEALNETHPQILHFSGHAESNGIMLVSSDGRAPHSVDADTLADLIRAFQLDLHLVVLSACHSLAHAEAISSIVDCTIGVRGLISDRGAIVFNGAFYRALASGRSVQTAFDQASAALKMSGFKEDGEAPQLVVRPGIDPAKVVLIPAAGAVTHRSAAPQLLVSPIVFSVPPIARDPDLIAVMMPFSREFTETYLEIRKACEAVGLRCERADTIWEESAVIQDVFNLIYRSTAIIVDLSGRNPNVMYECGIAHTLGRPVIPISRNTESLPFDLAHHRVLSYLPDAAGFAQMRAALESRLHSVTVQAQE